jgi:hypothetical protein
MHGGNVRTNVRANVRANVRLAVREPVEVDAAPSLRVMLPLCPSVDGHEGLCPSRSAIRSPAAPWGACGVLRRDSR